MAIENSLYDKKSLKTVVGKTADFNELAKDCVAFANSKGGVLAIGIEDDDVVPPSSQKVDDSLIATIEKRIAESTINVTAVAEKVTAENGGEYIALRIVYNAAAIASTSDGKYYMRSGDSSRPVKADEISLIFTDRPSFIWENQKSQAKYDECDIEKISLFVNDIRNATRVSDFVKSKSDSELLKYYHFVRDDYLTNLGALWIGNYYQRSDLGSAPKVQVIKYDSQGEKINKFVYDNDDLSPKELIDAIWNEIPDWKEYYEIPNTINRERVYAYEYKVIRELLVNAFVHRPYTMGGNIFIKLYPDRLEITNPGTLPLGITPENIINSSSQRNEAFGKIFYDLNYMEKEGSGYHLIYQLLLLNGKPLPKVEEGRDWVKVTVMRKPVNDNAFLFMFRINKLHELSQKQTIELGLLSQTKAFSIKQIAEILEIAEKEAFSIIDELHTAGILSKYADKDLYIVNGITTPQSEEVECENYLEKFGEATSTPQVTPQVTPQDTPQVKLEKLVAFCSVPKSQKEMMEFLHLTDRKNFSENYIKPLLGKKLEYTIPDKPTSSKQKYVAMLNM